MALTRSNFGQVHSANGFSIWKYKIAANETVDGLLSSTGGSNGLFNAVAADVQKGDWIVFEDAANGEGALLVVASNDGTTVTTKAIAASVTLT